MRFLKSSDISPKLGDIRVITRFALLPVLLNSNEYIWFEKYKSFEKYTRFSERYRSINTYKTYFWCDWKSLYKSDLNDCPKELYNLNEEKRVEKLNKKGIFTLKQFIENKEILNKVKKYEKTN